jgi:hypothetical protein
VEIVLGEVFETDDRLVAVSYAIRTKSVCQTMAKTVFDTIRLDHVPDKSVHHIVVGEWTYLRGKNGQIRGEYPEYTFVRTRSSITKLLEEAELIAGGREQGNPIASENH